MMSKPAVLKGRVVTMSNAKESSSEPEVSTSSSCPLTSFWMTGTAGGVTLTVLEVMVSVFTFAVAVFSMRMMPSGSM